MFTRIKYYIWGIRKAKQLKLPHFASFDGHKLKWRYREIKIPPYDKFSGKPYKTIPILVCQDYSFDRAGTKYWYTVNVYDLISEKIFRNEEALIQCYCLKDSKE